MDNDDLRRGKPTNHKVFGEAMAILAGDALLTEAFSMITSMQNANFKFAKSSIVEVIREVSIAQASMEWSEDRRRISFPRIPTPTGKPWNSIHLHKTAALIKASVKMGPILAGSKRSI